MNNIDFNVMGNCSVTLRCVSPAHKVSDDVGVAHQNLVAVCLLRRSMKVLTESLLNWRFLLEKILEENNVAVTLA